MGLLWFFLQKNYKKTLLLPSINTPSSLLHFITTKIFKILNYKKTSSQVLKLSSSEALSQALQALFMALKLSLKVYKLYKLSL